MKRITIVLLSGILILTACGQIPPTLQPTPILDSVSETSTPSLLPSSTPTTSITPLPTIPTFTPTFDVSTIVTVTPAPKAECPKNTENYEVLLPQPEQGGYPSSDIVQPILNFLNSGGTVKVLQDVLQELYGTYSPKIISADITNDGVPEIILDGVINKNSVYSQNYILMCNNGEIMNSKVVFETGKSNPYFPSSITFIKDLDGDSIPEIITKFSYGSGGNSFIIYGWDGSKFKTITEFTTATFTDETIDFAGNNGTRKVVVISKDSAEVSRHFDQTVRDRIITLEWNGKNFVITEEHLAPKFRFQAIQDADSAVIKGDFHKAISFYQEAVYSDTLDWWSLSRFRQQVQSGYGDPETTPIPTQPDLSEYPRLAAYAYYRIMLLHLVQNQESDATVTYNTLQQEFGNDPYAHPYVEMASAFWERIPVHAQNVRWLRGGDPICGGTS